MGADPCSSFGTIRAGTDDVQDDDDQANDEDDTLALEFGKRVALVDIVPLGVRDLGRRGRG